MPDDRRPTSEIVADIQAHVAGLPRGEYLRTLLADAADRLEAGQAAISDIETEIQAPANADSTSRRFGLHVALTILRRHCP